MEGESSPTSNNLAKAIQACLDNGGRLLDETYDLEFRNPPSSRYYLVLIAQEEFAKAFILFLIREQIVPWTSAVRRAINDHACKQLAGMTIDYMVMHWDEMHELEAIIKRDLDLGDRLPDDVASALEILRYEKIGRWTRNNWVWAEDPDYDRAAVKIADGAKDRRKQDALYIRLGSDGQVCSTPSVITEGEMHEELERARRYGNCVRSVFGGGSDPHWFDKPRFDKVMGAFRILFEAPQIMVSGDKQ
jgi:AbiV